MSQSDIADIAKMKYATNLVAAIKWDGSAESLGEIASLYIGVDPDSPNMRDSVCKGVWLLNTPDGPEYASVGDYIVKTVDGQIRRMDAKYFEIAYAPTHLKDEGKNS